MATKKGLQDLDISQDEISRIQEALKKEEFRKLLVEYAEEISDPKNKARYEAEIAQMENERGMDVKFINPEPGYVIKTTCNGDKKAYINICKNEHVAKPSSKSEKQGGRSGLNWSIPHSLTPPREDYDKTDKMCKVFDVVFNPDTLRMAETNLRFREIVNSVAIDGIERSFQVKLDRKNLKLPKMKFKGTPQATVIRTKHANGTTENRKLDPDDPLGKFPYPYDDKTSEQKSKEYEEQIKKIEKDKEESAKKTKQINDKTTTTDGYTVPKYSIVHRSDMDLSEYTNSRERLSNHQPKELVIHIDLPLLKSAKTIDLQFFEKRFMLTSETPAAYKLDLDLPYCVNDDQGSAKFDKAKRQLTLTLPTVESKNESNSDEVTDNMQLVNGHGTHEGALVEILSSEENDSSTNVMTNDKELSNGNGDVQQKDMVEGLSSESNDKRSDPREDPYHQTNDSPLEPPPIPKISYNCPPYDFLQDEQTTTFIFRVKNIAKDTVSKQFFENNTKCEIKFVSIGSGGFPLYYKFCVKFPDNCALSPNKCTEDVSDQNTVFILSKEKETLWDSFSAGLDWDNLEEDKFLTEANILESLSLLETVNDKEPSDDEVPTLQVIEFGEECIKINVKPSSKDSAEDLLGEDVDEQVDVEVVHNKPPPALHSILKQRSRTVSESSDDLGLSYSRENSLSYSSNGLASEDTISENDENGEPQLRKSVSFNDHVDTTMYKISAAVSTMKSTLKNKRRRAKKREQKEEQKHERRRRHSSTGSEHSSSEENVASNGKHFGRRRRHSSTGSECSSGEENQKNEVLTPLVVAASGSHVEDAASKLSPADINNSQIDATTCDLKNQKDVDRTIDKSSFNLHNEKGSSIEDKEIIMKNVGIGKKLKEETKAAVAKIVNCDTNNEELNSDDEEELQNEELKQKPVIEVISDSKMEREQSKEQLDPTAISWADKPIKGDDISHQTKCAFEFENNVVFDLDIE